MHFEFDQHVVGALDVVEAALVDPGFLSGLHALPRLGSAEVLDQQRDGDVVRQRVRYRFEVELSGAVRRVVDPEKLTWVEASSHDLSIHRAKYEILPDSYARLLQGSYDAALVDNGDTTVRHVTGEVKVRVALVGGKVERAIVDGLRENAAAQTDLLTAWANSSRDGSGDAGQS
jgi:hypothetical protein